MIRSAEDFMQPQLSPEVVSAIVHHLESWALESGPNILGSRLGGLINAALAPQNVRDFGGLRLLVQTALSPYVRSLGLSVEAQDYMYEIITASQAGKRPLHTPQSTQEVVGADLWRFFSNPNIECAMAVSPPSVVVVAPRAEQLPAGVVALTRMESSQYQTWAKEFAEEHGLSQQFEASTLAPDFYKAWIPALRKVATAGMNYLKAWEILRTDKVAQHLTDQLKAAQVDALRAAEIVKLARPVGRPSRSVIAPLMVAEPRKPYLDTSIPSSTQSDLTSLRQVLHRAIDVMTLEELREIRVRAGTWMAIFEKPGM